MICLLVGSFWKVYFICLFGKVMVGISVWKCHICPSCLGGRLLSLGTAFCSLCSWLACATVRQFDWPTFDCRWPCSSQQSASRATQRFTSSVPIITICSHHRHCSPSLHASAVSAHFSMSATIIRATPVCRLPDSGVSEMAGCDEHKACREV